MSNVDLTKPQNNAPAVKKDFNTVLKEKMSNIMTGKRLENFVVDTVAMINKNPALAQCTHVSLVSSVLQAESLNLSLNSMLGQCYIVPFKSKAKFDRNGNMTKPEVTEATFQIGYKGYIQLAIRSGEYKKINVMSIKKGELIFYDPLNEEIQVNLIQDEIEREQAETIGYYAMFEYTNGFRKAMYWSKEKMVAHADRYSQAFSMNATAGQYPKVSYADFALGKYPKNDEWKYSSFWYKDFDGMAYKTMLRQILSKWGIMSIEMQKGYESDYHSIDETGKPTEDFIDADFTEAPPQKEEVVEPESINQENQEPQQEQQASSEDDKVKAEEREKQRAALMELRAKAKNLFELSGIQNPHSKSPELWGTAQCNRVIELAENALREMEQAQNQQNTLDWN